MNKPRVAVFDFACCEGCQLQILNLEEDLLNLIAVIDPVEWREAMSDRGDDFDIAVVEGSITREEDEERLQEIRARSRTLIALGACATIGGINKLKNRFDLDEVKRAVYGEEAGMPHLETARTKALDEVVHVDWKIHGCPINNREFAAFLRALLVGAKPFVPNYPVCVECKMRANPCRFDYNEICLGPVTRAGCGAPCPSGGFWCYGCRGYVDEPNIEAAKEIMKHYGRTVAELRSRLLLFGTGGGRTS